MTALKCDKCSGRIFLDGGYLTCFNCGKVFYHIFVGDRGLVNGVSDQTELVSKEYKRHNYGAIPYKNNEKEYRKNYNLRHKVKLRAYKRRYYREVVRLKTNDIGSLVASGSLD